MKRLSWWHLAALATLAVVSVVLAEILSPLAVPLDGPMLGAARRMQRAISVLSSYRAVHGPPFSDEDIHRTGLIGSFYTPLTTTVGSVEAKRTSTQPAWASVAIDLLLQADLTPNDAIAVGASGSFPAVLLAVLCASAELQLDVGLIISLGASQWGANLLEFTWLEMEAALLAAGALPGAYRANAVSFGGADDVGRDLSDATRETLRERAAVRGIELIEIPDLVANVATRRAVYDAAVQGKEIAAFVNIGGATANVGTSTALLGMPPGVHRIPREELPPIATRGALHAFAADGIPVIHWLDLASLAARYGLPWDPSPLPDAATWTGATRSAAASAIGAVFLAIATLYPLGIRWCGRVRRESPRHEASIGGLDHGSG
jgi:poly-gamma-glutamate system protein